MGSTQLRLRIAADVRFGDVLPVLMAITRAGYGALELEVTSAGEVGQLELRPYVWCACGMPSQPTWCAVPELRVDRRGVTIRGTPDITPSPGCHRAIRHMGQQAPVFAAEVDWRERPIAGPQGGCPSAAVADDRLDVAALVERVRALQRVAPGCRWMAAEVDDEVPWSIVAPALAAVYAEFGPLRTRFGPVSEQTCARPMQMTELSRATPGPAPSTFSGRVGCVD